MKKISTSEIKSLINKFKYIEVLSINNKCAEIFQN